MSGQSAALSIKEAKAMMERTRCGPDAQGTSRNSSNGAEPCHDGHIKGPDSQGGKSKKGSMAGYEVMKKGEQG